MHGGRTNGTNIHILERLINFGKHYEQVACNRLLSGCTATVKGQIRLSCLLKYLHIYQLQNNGSVLYIQRTFYSQHRKFYYYYCYYYYYYYHHHHHHHPLYAGYLYLYS